MKTLIVLTLLAVTLSGCMPSRGWQFSFGITPVSSIDNNTGFTAPDAKPKVAGARY